jgi:hypothetical protein
MYLCKIESNFAGKFASKFASNFARNFASNFEDRKIHLATACKFASKKGVAKSMGVD